MEHQEFLMSLSEIETSIMEHFKRGKKHIPICKRPTYLRGYAVIRGCPDITLIKRSSQPFIE